MDLNYQEPNYTCKTYYSSISQVLGSALKVTKTGHSMVVSLVSKIPPPIISTQYYQLGISWKVSFFFPPVRQFFASMFEGTIIPHNNKNCVSYPAWIQRQLLFFHKISFVKDIKYLLGSFCGSYSKCLWLRFMIPNYISIIHCNLVCFLLHFPVLCHP